MKQEMLFTVMKDGVPKMSTNHENCIPSKEEIRKLKAAGYKIIDRRPKKVKGETEK